jgi:hypothetical protein
VNESGGTHNEHLKTYNEHLKTFIEHLKTFNGHLKTLMKLYNYFSEEKNVTSSDRWKLNFCF